MEKKRIKIILIALALLAVIIFLGSVSKKNNDYCAGDNNTFALQKSGANVGLQTQYSSSGIYFRLIFAVFIVAGLAFAVYWLGRQFRYKACGGKRGRIEVLETTYLAARKTLHIVKVGDKTFLIGSTNDSIRSLADLSDSFSEEDL